MHSACHETTLRESAWAKNLFGYADKTDSAFWQWAHSACVPMVRLGHRKIMFDEQQVRDFISRRSTGSAS